MISFKRMRYFFIICVFNFPSGKFFYGLNLRIPFSRLLILRFALSTRFLRLVGQPNNTVYNPEVRSF